MQTLQRPMPHNLANMSNKTLLDKLYWHLDEATKRGLVTAVLPTGINRLPTSVPSDTAPIPAYKVDSALDLDDYLELKLLPADCLDVRVTFEFASLAIRDARADDVEGIMMSLGGYETDKLTNLQGARLCHVFFALPAGGQPAEAVIERLRTQFRHHCMFEVEINTYGTHTVAEYQNMRLAAINAGRMPKPYIPNGSDAPYAMIRVDYSANPTEEARGRVYEDMDRHHGEKVGSEGDTALFIFPRDDDEVWPDVVKNLEEELTGSVGCGPIKVSIVKVLTAEEYDGAEDDEGQDKAA